MSLKIYATMPTLTSNWGGSYFFLWSILLYATYAVSECHKLSDALALHYRHHPQYHTRWAVGINGGAENAEYLAQKHENTSDWIIIVWLF